MFDRETTARNLQAARVFKGYTQAELAELAGVSEGSIRLYESGRVEMGLGKACRIADALGVKLEQIVAVKG